MVDLLPCPFCGSKPDSEDPMTFGKSPGGKYGFVTCCCEGPEIRLGRADEESWKIQAAAAWNRRAVLGESVFRQRIKQGALFFFHVIGWLCVIFIAWLGINVLGTVNAEAKEPAKVTLIGVPSAWREECLARKKIATDITWLRVSGKALEDVLEDYEERTMDNDFDEEQREQLKKLVIAIWNFDSGIETPGDLIFRVCMASYKSSQNERLRVIPRFASTIDPRPCE